MTDVILDVVASAARDFAIQEAITAGELERTITGASTLTLDVHDPHRKLIRSKEFQRAVDLQFDRTWFRLVKLTKTGDQATLVFEDRDVAYLRQHDQPRKASRGRMTRAQFVRALVREVKASPIIFASPEVNEHQPISKAKRDAQASKRDESERRKKRQRGLAASDDLTVKGTRATAEQRRNAERVLDVADSLGAGGRATQALLVAVIQESLIRNLTHGDASSVGILQLLDIHGSVALRRNIENVVKLFLTKGFTGSGSAIDLANKHADWDPAEIAAAVQGNQQGARDYRPWIKEAKEWVDAYGGPREDFEEVKQVRKRYEFSRGEPGKPEDSWTAIQRLAEEVNWRAFMDRGTLYFASEDHLIASKARHVITEDSPGIHWIDFDIDQGKVKSEMTVSCRADLYEFDIGSVVAVRDLGIASGRYLVTAVRQSVFDTDAEISLAAATPKLPEPDTTLAQRTKTLERVGGFKLNSRTARMYRKADAIDKKSYSYHWSGGHANFDGPYDCSGAVSAVLHAGGLLDTPQSTAGLISWGRPGEGVYMTVWVKETGNPHQSHTFITFNVEGETKYFEAGGAESDHTGWHQERSHEGFTPRHYPDGQGDRVSDYVKGQGPN